MPGRDSDSDNEFIPDADEMDRGRGKKKSSRGGKKGSKSSSNQNRGMIRNTIMDQHDDDAPVVTDFRHLTLKPDHKARPIWVTPTGLIILEATSPIYQQAYDFLVAIAEPQARPEFIHRYMLTRNSLYAAVAVSIDTHTIISVLKKLCKTTLPLEVEAFIKESTSTFGKSKIVLKNNQFYIESPYPDILRRLLRVQTIRMARDQGEHELAEAMEKGREERELATGPGGGRGRVVDADGFTTSAAPKEMGRNFASIGLDLGLGGADEEEEGGAEAGSSNVSEFPIGRHCVQEVKRCALEIEYPLMEEYAFTRDLENPVLPIDLRPSTKIRAYQEKSLAKMFGNGRARSGIIVLPCGAGKSLTGVTAASTIKRSTIVLCVTNASAKQWKDQFTGFSTVPEGNIRMYTSDSIQMPTPGVACVVITTYSMICHSGRRRAAAQQMLDAVMGREWGLLILDEVHTAPATNFRKVLQIVNAHCKLGLTATLVREDDQINDLHFLVGPKLYEANWMDLTQQGFLANVQCCEVWCPMTAEFFAEYIQHRLTAKHESLLAILNPIKMRACEYLVKYHEARGDKIIIFCDDITSIECYCAHLKRPKITGNTSHDERQILLAAFRMDSRVSCIGLSRVGDVALDLPEANVVIQVTGLGGSRRQEAQRLGRILRPKANPSGGFNAYFYSLVSNDTREMYFSSKRQQYLIDQGYTFKVVQDLVERSERESRFLKGPGQELDLLTELLAMDPSQDAAVEEENLREIRGDEEEEEEEDEDETPMPSRRVGGAAALSGGADLQYMEYGGGEGSKRKRK